MKLLLKPLHIFIKTVELNSMSRAAKALNISASGVSQQLSKLEQDLGTNLLHRNTRRIALTQEGEIFYRYGLQVLDTMGSAQEELDSLKDRPLGSLRLFAPVGFAGNGILSKPLLYLAQNYQYLNIELILSDDDVDMVAQSIDIALRVGIGPMPDSSLIARHLVDWQMGLFVSPGYLAGFEQVTTIDDLAQMNWLRHANQDPNLLHLEQPKLIVNNMQALTRLTLDGLGFAILPVPEAQPLVDKGELAPILTDQSFPVFSIFAVTTHKSPHSAKVVAALEALTESFNLAAT